MMKILKVAMASAVIGLIACLSASAATDSFTDTVSAPGVWDNVAQAGFNWFPASTGVYAADPILGGASNYTAYEYNPVNAGAGGPNFFDFLVGMKLAADNTANNALHIFFGPFIGAPTFNPNLAGAPAASAPGTAFQPPHAVAAVLSGSGYSSTFGINAGSFAGSGVVPPASESMFLVLSTTNPLAVGDSAEVVWAQPAAIPEPGSFVLLSSLGLAAWFVRRRRMA